MSWKIKQLSLKLQASLSYVKNILNFSEIRTIPVCLSTFLEKNKKVNFVYIKYFGRIKLKFELRNDNLLQFHKFLQASHSRPQTSKHWTKYHLERWAQRKLMWKRMLVSKFRSEKLRGSPRNSGFWKRQYYNREHIL